MLLQVQTYSSWEAKTLILPSLSKIQVDEFDRFFFSRLLPGDCSIVVGVIVPHQSNGMVCRDVVLPHEISNLQVGFDFPSGLCGLSPGEAVSLGRFSLSSFSRISLVLGQMASLLVADEALAASDVLCSFTRREIDLVNVHHVRIGARGLASWRDIAVSSSSEFPESHHIAIELSHFVKPLFPLPTSLILSIWEGGSSHHDSELLGYSSLEGIYEDAVVIDSAACLGQFKGHGVLVEVSVELIHAKGIDSLVGSVLEILWDKGFFEGFAYLFEGFLGVRDAWVG